MIASVPDLCILFYFCWVHKMCVLKVLLTYLHSVTPILTCIVCSHSAFIEKLLKYNVRLLC